MMNTQMIQHACIVKESTGEILARLSNVTETMALANSAEGCVVIARETPTDECYWDAPSDAFVKLPPRPNNHCTFNYATRAWEDPRSLLDAQNARWKELKIQRDALEYAGFEFEGRLYDSDLKAQSRILAAASLGIAVEWTLADNSVVWLEPADLQRLIISLATHITAIHSHGKIAREKIFNATTITEIEAIELLRD